MDQQQTVENLLSEPWSNGACRGYVISAMKSAGFAHEDIRRVMGELRWVFDTISIKEAEECYCRGSY